MRKFLFSIFGLVIASACLFSGNAFAEDNTDFQIRPTSNAFTLVEGNTMAYSLAISNTGDHPLTYKLYSKPYSVESTDGIYTPIFDDVNNTHAQMYRWITFQTPNGDFATTTTYTINPGESQTIPYRINIPEGIPAGGQYSAIFAQTIPDTDVSNTGVKTVSRVTLLLYGHGAGDTTETADITEFKITGILTAGNISGSAKVVNGGNTDFDAECEFTVKGIFGKVYYTSGYTYPILPETEYRTVSEWSETPAFGIFNVHFRVKALDHEIEKTRIVIVMPVFMMIIMLLLLTAIIIWIIILIRKRKEHNSRLVI